MLVSTVASLSPSGLSLLDEICIDENVMNALGEAISLAASKTLQDFVPGDSPLSYVGGRLFLDAVTLATGRLRPYEFYPVDPNNQRHLINKGRYSEPITIILSGAKKVKGGFKVARKGYMTLYMIENCGQGLLFGEDEKPPSNPTFWLLHEIDRDTGYLKVYLARPTRLLKNGTFLEATEFRVIFPVLTADDASSTPIEITESDLPQGTEINVSYTEVTEVDEP